MGWLIMVHQAGFFAKELQHRGIKAQSVTVMIHSGVLGI